MSAEACGGFGLDTLMEDAPTYSTAEAARISGVAPHTLHRLAAAGVITSSVSACGSGSRRRWSPLEVDRLSRIGDVTARADDAGLLVTWEAVAQMWRAMAADRPWRVILAA
jgi:hypothetical protein